MNKTCNTQKNNRVKHNWRSRLMPFVPLVFLGILFGFNPDARAQSWVPQASGTTNALFGLYFINESQGWVVGEGGTIRTTTDGGATWTGQTSGVTNSLTTAYFVSETQGWITGESGTILTTTNGTDWIHQGSGVTTRLNGVYFTSATQGWAVGDGGVIRTTTDGGANWTAQTSGTTADLYRVEFISTTEGWIVGTNGIILHTLDGGALWSKQLTGLSLTHYDLSFVTPSLGWVSAGGTVFNTANGGTSWNPQPSAPTGANSGIQFISPTNGWLASTNGINASGIYKTTDGGANWVLETALPGALLSGIFMLSPTMGWAVDAGGKIFTYVVPPCNNPTVPVLFSLETNICGGGQPVTLKVSEGELNDAQEWEWYTGGCGGTNTGHGVSIQVFPTETTTYYARGEGNCVTSGGPCASITIEINPVPAAPTIFPAGGTYPSAPQVTLISNAGNAPIYYTIDGTQPDTTSLLYTGPFTATNDMTVKAISMLGTCPSITKSEHYLIVVPLGTVAKPVLSNESGTYTGVVSVAITCATPEAKIYYTTNGNRPRFDVPNSFTKLYTGPFEIFVTSTLRAIAVKEGFYDSQVAVANYIVSAPNVVAAPTFTPPAGNYPGTISIAVNSTTPEATIYLTTNGITPSNTTAAARLYTAPFNLSKSITLKAIAYRTGFQTSSVSVGIYTIGPGRRIVEDGADFYYENDAYAEEITKDVRFAVFPNPTSGKFQFQSEGFSSGIELTVHNLVGQVVKTNRLDENQTNAEMDLTSLPSGLYHVSVVSGQIRKEFKITKQ